LRRIVDGAIVEGARALRRRARVRLSTLTADVGTGTGTIVGFSVG